MYAKDLPETILTFIYYSRIVKNGSIKKLFSNLCTFWISSTIQSLLFVNNATIEIQECSPTVFDYFNNTDAFYYSSCGNTNLCNKEYHCLQLSKNL